MLKNRIVRLLACFLAVASAISLPAQGQVWDFLGVTQIDGTRDHDKIQVTRRDGVFHAIQLRVSGDAIFFDRVVVHFGDGTSEALAVQGRIWPEGRNHIIGFSVRDHTGGKISGSSRVNRGVFLTDGLERGLVLLDVKAEGVRAKDVHLASLCKIVAELF